MEWLARLNEFFRSQEITDEKLSRVWDVTEKTVYNRKKGLRKIEVEELSLLLISFPNLSAEWLLRGIGNMEISDNENKLRGKNDSIVEDLKIRISSLEKKVLELENTNKKLEEDKAELRVDKDDFRREKNEYKTKLEEALEKLKTVQSMAQSQMVFSAGDTTIETMELKNHVVNH